MLSTTVQQSTFSLPSLPTIAINTRFLSAVRDHAHKASEIVARNKFISAFMVVFSAPVD